VNPRELLNGLLLWATLSYGLFATTLEPAWSHDDVQIAVGAETVALALVGFLWAGRRRPLGAALIVTGSAAPFAMLGAASIYWDDPYALDSPGLWTSLLGGVVVGLPLIVLGVVALRRLTDDRRPDRWWLVLVRWAVFAGFWVMLLAFRGDSWSGGAVLVYVGAAIAMISLLVVLGYRYRINTRGLGRLLLALGLSGLIITALAFAVEGGRMSGDEAAYGLLPAGVVTFLGLVLVRLKPRRTVANEKDGERDLSRLDLTESVVADIAHDVQP